MFLAITLILMWLTILIFWAEYLVKWAGSLAKKAWIPPLVIWLTVVAFWTSAPELIVNLFSALQWNTSLALWNILWSNIANILLILWFAWLFNELRVNKSTTRKEIPFALLAIVAIRIMSNDIFLDWWTKNILTRTDWLMLMWFFAVFMYYTVDLTRQWNDTTDEEIELYATRKSILFTLWWCVWLFLWGKLLVDNAVHIATVMGISERIIWLTIVAIWTSLPELATSLVAVRKGQTDIAIWNVVWSNIFNIFWILWLTSMITAIPLWNEVQFDIVICVFATLILFFTMFIDKKHHLQRRQSAILLTLYICYLCYLIFT